MFTLKWTLKAGTQYDKIKKDAEKRRAARQISGKRKSSKQEGLFNQVHKSVNLLLSNPRHPGLETHEYHSLENPYNRRAKVFEAYAQQKTPAAYRIFWCYGPGKREITIIAITPHP